MTGKKMTKKVKKYTPEFKTKVVMELLREKATQNKLSQKYGILTCTMRAWYNLFLDNAESLFTGRQQDKTYRDTIKEKVKEINELHQTVGELTVSVNWLKKKYREVGIEYPKKYDI